MRPAAGRHQTLNFSTDWLGPSAMIKLQELVGFTRVNSPLLREYPPARERRVPRPPWRSCGNLSSRGTPHEPVFPPQLSDTLRWRDELAMEGSWSRRQRHGGGVFTDCSERARQCAVGGDVSSYGTADSRPISQIGIALSSATESLFLIRLRASSRQSTYASRRHRGANRTRGTDRHHQPPVDRHYGRI